MTLLCKSLSIWQCNPIHGCGVKITPDINPINVELGRSCPRDSKNVSFFDMGLVQTVLDLIKLRVGWSQSLVKGAKLFFKSLLFWLAVE